MAYKHPNTEKSSGALILLFVVILAVLIALFALWYNKQTYITVVDPSGHRQLAPYNWWYDAEHKK